MEIEKKEWYTFNTPAGLNLELMFADFSIKFKPKAEFLIHQINFYNKNGGYQINSKNHCWLLGIKGGELATILGRLIDSGIIIKVKNFTPGNTSNTYKMVKPLDMATAQKSYYKIDNFQFLKKWAADNHIVKNADMSNFEKNPATKSSIIAAQKREINMLKSQVLELHKKSDDSVFSDLLVKYEEDLMMHSPIPEVTMPFDTHVEEEEMVIGLPVQENGLLSDLLVEDEEDLRQLELIFNNTEVSNVECKLTSSHMTKSDSISEFPIIKNTELISNKIFENLNDVKLVEQFNDLGDGFLKYDTVMNGYLEILPYGDMLCIIYGDKQGCIENYEQIKPWCSQLPRLEQQSLYYSLIESTGNTITIPLNRHTKAQFKREETEAGIVFNYVKLT